MGPGRVSTRLDIVGHFGTTFSYATVAAELAHALLERGQLGLVTNLDPAWHPEHEALRAAGLARAGQQGSHVLVVSAPHHYYDVFPGTYGRERAAIFMSPNTDTLSAGHAAACSMFGMALAPSEWCANVTRRALFDLGADTRVVVTPLGVDPSLYRTRERRAERLHCRLDTLSGTVVVHFSSDQSWPGRKGTEELLAAWAILFAGRPDGMTRLRLHVPPALHMGAVRMCRDLEIDQSCEVVIGGMLGSAESDLAALLDDADLVVAPSRCEGFGMMFASALVANVPLLCTYVTGQRDFLRVLPGWLGVPTGEPAPMAGEDGLAPVVDPEVLAEHLAIALKKDVRRELLSRLSGSPDKRYLPQTWAAAARDMASAVSSWMEEEDG